MSVLPIDEVVLRHYKGFDIVAQSSACGEVSMKQDASRPGWDDKLEVAETECVYVQGGILDSRRALLLDDSVNRTSSGIGIGPLAGVIPVDHED